VWLLVIEERLKMKKILLATLGYAIVTFALAVPWHFVLFHDVYAELGAYKLEQPIFALGMTAMLVQGVVIAYLFQFYHRGVRPFREGIGFAMIMGVYMYTLSTVAFAAKTPVTSLPTWFTVQFGFHFLQFLLAGVVLGFVYGKRGN
jgi:hypothetical protein